MKCYFRCSLTLPSCREKPNKATTTIQKPPRAFWPRRINEALPESIENQEEIDNVLSILQNLEIEILEPDQVEDYKQRQEEAEEEESRSSQNDILDDPVRMYLKQMGQVPLLTREQEVEISKRIENAELKAQEALFQASAVGGYIAVLGAKLLNREERFDRIVSSRLAPPRPGPSRRRPAATRSERGPSRSSAGARPRSRRISPNSTSS